MYVYGRIRMQPLNPRFWKKVVSQARAKRREAKSFGRKLDH
jgi:hypothetical protein